GAPLTAFGFVVVKLGGIDVTVAEPQRLLDHTRARPPAQLPGAQPDERDARAMCLEDMRRNCHQHLEVISFAPVQLSHCGACGGSTTRRWVCLRRAISVISASLNLKSNTVRLAARWSGLAVRGIGVIPCCTRYRSATSSSFSGTLPRASGQ